MAFSGPVPKRSEERLRRNKPEVEIVKIQAQGEVVQPELGLGDVHPVVQDLWDSMGESAQSQWFEPSDWQYARFIMHFANMALYSGRPNAQILAEVNKALGELLVSEGARRRVRIEIERNKAQAEVVSIADELARRMRNMGS